MDDMAYRALDAVNWSKLKRLRLSPKHYAYGLADDGAETDALVLGRVVHTLVLEPLRYADRYVVWDEGKRSGKDWTAFAKAHSDRTILTLDLAARAMSIAAAVEGSPVAAQYLRQSGGQAECSITWSDVASGLMLKARIDWRVPGLVLDLKTSRHAVEPRLFAADAFRLGYFHQLAYYQRGANAVFGGEHDAVIVAVEPTAPYDVAVYRPDDDALYAVTEETDELLAQLVKCRESREWPGRFAVEQMLPLPRWAYPTAEDEIMSAKIVDVTKDW